jgi:hypothetical protein
MLDLDVWHASKSHIDVLLNTKTKSHFLSLLPAGLHEDAPLIKSDMLEALLTRPTKKHPRRPPPSQPPIPSPPIDMFNLTTLQSPFHDTYHSMDNITEFGKQLEKTFPGLVKRFVVGKSAEGRDVEGLRLHKYVNLTEQAEGEWSVRTIQGRRKGGVQEAKPRVFYLQGGQHAREVSLPLSLVKKMSISRSLIIVWHIVDFAILGALFCAPLAHPGCHKPQPGGPQITGNFRICDRADHQPGRLRIRACWFSAMADEIKLTETDGRVSYRVEHTRVCGGRIDRI